ncbi:MAG: recombinase family protein [Candidatus Omnitrophota bacterium]
MDNKFIAFYSRVSTDEQTNENQQLIFRDYIESHQIPHNKCRMFLETASGFITKRPVLHDLIERIRLGQIEKVVIKRLSRLARSLKQLIGLLELFDKYKVELITLRENIDTGSANGKLFFHILGAMAQFERDLIVERTKDGIKRAKLNGKKLGRPKGKKDIKKRSPLPYLQYHALKRAEKKGSLELSSISPVC